MKFDQTASIDFDCIFKSLRNLHLVRPEDNSSSQSTLRVTLLISGTSASNLDIKTK